MIRYRKLFFIFLLLLFISFSAFGGELSIAFIDVGQGDSMLIATPSGKNILIDGGGIPSWHKKVFRIGSKVLVPFLRKRNIKELDFVILTHGHTDHVDGLIDVLKTFPVKEVVDTKEGGGNVTDDEYATFLKTIEKKNIRYRIVEEGDTLDFGGEVSARVLNPPKGFRYQDINDNSLVLKINHKEISFLLTADTGEVTERYLSSRFGQELKTDILKVGHHGSKTSTCAQFLDGVQPEVAVISCGRKNSFGHPHPDVIKRLKRKKVKTYSTAQYGTVTIKSDGKNYSVETEYK